MLISQTVLIKLHTSYLECVRYPTSRYRAQAQTIFMEASEVTEAIPEPPPPVSAVSAKRLLNDTVLPGARSTYSVHCIYYSGKLPRIAHATPSLRHFPFQTFTILYDLYRACVEPGLSTTTVP